LSIETEVKIEIEDPEDFCRRLHGLGAVPVSSRHFEDNHLLDFPDHRLGSNRCLLRIRFAGKQAYLTYKGPPRPEGIFKTREELEIILEDNATSLQIFERIGMLVDFRYQKHRREFVLDDVHIAVDETPIGNYAELEGSEQFIRALALRLGITESQFLRLSYYSLYLEYCRKMNKIPQSMIF
jgi:adenylate cyclase class 2